MSIFRQRKIKKAAICCLFNNYALFFALAEHAVFGFDRLAERGGKAAQSFLLRRGEVFRDRDSHSHELVASAAGAQERNALALEAEGRAGLRALGYVELYLTVERGNLDLRAERRSRKGYVLIKEHRRALALKPCVGLHEHRYQQIAGRAAVYAGVALSAQRYGLSVVDAGRDADAHLVLAADAADAVAGAARAMDDLAATLALTTARVLLHHTERRALRGFHLTRALAVGADLGSRARGAACALAVGALLNARYEHFLFDAERRFLKLYVHVCAQIFALARSVRVLTAATAAEAENVAEYIAKAAEITGIVLTKLDGTAKGGVVFAVKRELGIPVKFIGVGEGAEDLQPFSGADFVRAMFERDGQENAE